MRIGVRLGPVSVSTSTHSRRRSRSSQPNWHAKGKATTPDGREVDFRCHHSHRSQDAAIKCAATIRKQIEHGQNLHLITRVRSTPASREAARQRAVQQEARRQAKAAERARAGQQRAEQREARRQAKAASRGQTDHQRAEHQEARRQADVAKQAEAARYRAQQNAAPVLHRHPMTGPPQVVQIMQQPAERNREAAYHPAEQWQSFHQPNEQIARRYGPPPQQRSLGWPAIGLIVSGAATVVGLILAGVAGSNSKSALATTAGGIITLAVIGILVFAVAALLKRRRRPRNEEARPSIPVSQGPRATHPAPSTFTRPSSYIPGAHSGAVAAEQQPHGVPPRPPWDGAPRPPYGDGAPWPRQ